MLDKQLEARLQDAQVSIIGSMLIDDRCIKVSVPVRGRGCIKVAESEYNDLGFPSP